MTEAVATTTITTVGLVLVALLGLLAGLQDRTRRHAKAARIQVENDHTTNMREEGDDRHHQNTRTLGRIEDMQAFLIVQHFTHEGRLDALERRYTT